MSRIREILLILLFVFVVIQFIRPARNSSTSEQHGDFLKLYKVPVNVSSSLKTSCYDCHSNNTHYPWYANIQPFGWLLAKHIRKGKKELNFSEFGMYSKRRQSSKLKTIAVSIKEGAMPLSSYTLMHGDARFDNSKKQLLIDWFMKSKDSLDTQP